MAVLVIFTILFALTFDFYNGMNDAANSVATIVSTRVLTPRQAVVWAAFWNFAAAFFLGTAVAKTIHGKVLTAESISITLVIATLVGAVFWTHFCTHLGLPISASHALIGGLIGAGLVQSSFDFAVLKAGSIWVVVAFIFLAPIIGLIGGSFLMFLVYWVFRNTRPQKVDRLFRGGQLFSAAAVSLGHGSNDAQKTMGIITMALVAGGYLATPHDPVTGLALAPNIPIWVIVAAYTSIAFGTLIGGWKVIRTMGTKLTTLRPAQGFCAEVASAFVLFGTSHAGIPVSTTHCVAGSIMGVGAVKRIRAVRWGVAKGILWAWVVTIPCTAIVSGLAYWIFDISGFVSFAQHLK